MCCWTQDRQANDGNGDCDTPYDTNCVDADPADNTDLCYVDMSRAQTSSRVQRGYAVFPGDDDQGEGAIHCHGKSAHPTNSRDCSFRLGVVNLLTDSLLFFALFQALRGPRMITNSPSSTEPTISSMSPSMITFRHVDTCLLLAVPPCVGVWSKCRLSAGTFYWCTWLRSVVLLICSNITG